ncbi:hypothetical protein [Mycoplasmopsis arginini]|uniref:hypothetical protein n=1 Tax=Mycoplasmopsis arginini TaxID=2094 RepID=UPI003CFE3117
MKKSSKLLIGLTFLAATATAASVALTVATVVKKTPKKQLSKQIKIFEEELETNKDLKEFQKAEIKLALEAAQAVLSNPESTNEEIKNALDVLVKKVEEIKAQTEEPETPEQKLAKAKAAYDEKVKASTELMAQLTTEDGKYSEIKTTFENEVTSAKADVPAENATVENYQSATTKLNDAIAKAQKAKETKDAELAAFETAKNAYDAKVTEATQLATQLTSEDGKYNEIKTTFDQEVNEAKALVPSENPTKENYESATAKLSAAITKTSEAKEAKDQEIIEFETIRHVYNTRVEEATQLSTELDNDKYRTIKTTFDQEVETAKADVPESNPTKENYQSATSKLNAAIAKANQAKEDKDRELAALETAKTSYNNKVREAEELVTTLSASEEKYGAIKTKLQNSLNEAKQNINDQSTTDQYNTAISAIEDAIETANTEKEAKDAELAAFENAKNAYDAKVSEATQLATQLTSEDGKYNEIKTTFDQEVNEAKALVPSENPTKENYESATAKLSAAITKATEAKNAKDQAEAEAAAKAQALQQFNTLKQEVETYLATLTAPEKQTIKNELEEELNKQKQIAEASDATSEIINNAKNALKAKLDETKAKENNEEGPSTNVEELTEAQRAIVEKVNNKTILTGTVAENVKSEILKLSSTKLSDSPNDKNYFGYLKNNKQTKTFTFGSTNKKAKTALGDNLFAQEFLDMASNKEIVFAVSNSQRLALCFDKKEDGKIVIPFRFKDKTTIYEIELF